MNKLVIFVILLICFTGSYGQHRKFLTVSVNNNVRPVKGFFVRTGDSDLVLRKGKNMIGLNYRNIQFVKTRKSIGHDIFLGTVLGAAGGAVIGLATYKKPPPGIISLDFGPAFDAGVGLGIGAVAGFVIGSVHGLLKHKERFEVKGLYQNWHALKAGLDK